MDYVKEIESHLDSLLSEYEKCRNSETLENLDKKYFLLMLEGIKDNSFRFKNYFNEWSKARETVRILSNL